MLANKCKYTPKQLKHVLLPPYSIGREQWGGLVGGNSKSQGGAGGTADGGHSATRL